MYKLIRSILAVSENHMDLVLTVEIPAHRLTTIKNCVTIYGIVEVKAGMQIYPVRLIENE